MYYYKLMTKKIPKYKNSNITISIESIKKLLKIFYTKYHFSTLPYLVNNLNSKQSISKFNSGNCVALCLKFKQILKKHNILSYIIPATIPKIYRRENFLDISHVALAIPISSTDFFIIDLAFYFYEPIIYSDKDLELQYITLADIYRGTNKSVQIHNKIMPTKIKFNKYQTIPKGTKYSECNYLDDPDDVWKYFLIELINPDLAISTPYINNIKPFITITNIYNDDYRMFVHLKFENDILIIKINNQLYYNNTLDALTENHRKYLNHLLGKYLKKDIKEYLNFKQKKLYTIHD
jgi:hypothetical protein